MISPCIYLLVVCCPWPSSAPPRMLCINFGRRPDQHARFRAQWMQHQNYNFCLALNSSLTSLLFFLMKGIFKRQKPKKLVPSYTWDSLLCDVCYFVCMVGDDYTVCIVQSVTFTLYFVSQPHRLAGFFSSLSQAALDFIVWSHQQALSPPEVWLFSYDIWAQFQAQAPALWDFPGNLRYLWEMSICYDPWALIFKLLIIHKETTSLSPSSLQELPGDLFNSFKIQPCHDCIFPYLLMQGSVQVLDQ